MKTRSVISHLFRLSLLLAVGLWLAGSLAWAATQLVLDKPIHFRAADGTDTLVDAGTYAVDTPSESRMRFIAEGKPEIVLDTQKVKHTETIEQSVAITVSGEDPDVMHVVLLLPGGQALDAIGSVSGTRLRGTREVTITAGQLQNALAAQQPRLPTNIQVPSPALNILPPPITISRIDYLADYPSNYNPGWAENLQGVAHDQGNWFFTQKEKLWKFPLSHDINRNIKNGIPVGINRVEMPSLLKHAGYNHFGDLDHYRGFLFIPIEGSGKPGIAVFRASDLAFLGSYTLTQQVWAGWCAVRLEVNGLYLYSSNNQVDAANPIFRYRIDLQKLQANPPTVGSAFQYMGFVQLFHGITPISIPQYLQGGEFSPDGSHLFLVNGKSTGKVTDGGIWVFKGSPFQYVAKSTESRNPSNWGSFVFEWHPSHLGRQEPEGITFWDLDGGQSPQLPGGQLHVILLDNDPGEDEIWIKHYRVMP